VIARQERTLCQKTRHKVKDRERAKSYKVSPNRQKNKPPLIKT
jgi:hypothetical protein